MVGLDSTATGGRQVTGMALPPLGIGVGLMVLMTLAPSIATTPGGEADHPTALLLFWAMCAGFVRGVGYIPENRLARSFLSGYSCLGALVLALARLFALGKLGLPA